MRALVLIALVVVGGPPWQLPNPTAAIDVAKHTSVRDMDGVLPRMTFEDWLRGLVGPQAVVTWEANDCGEQTGTVADRGRDFPLCAEARVNVAANRTLGLSLAVGTLHRGVTGDTPVLFSAYLTGPNANDIVWFKTFEEVSQQFASRAQAQEKPMLGAYFAKESLLAFWIECRNPSGTNVPRQDSRWLQSYRIDGVQPPPGRGRGGSGPNPEMAPGATWRGILVLHSFSSSWSSRAVADVKISISADILPGRHTIAVQCFDAWSDDLAFMWDPAD